MTQSIIAGNVSGRTQRPSFFPDLRTGFTSGLAVAALLTATIGAAAQSTASPDNVGQAASTPATPQTDAAPPASATPAPASAQQSTNISNQPASKTRKQNTVAPPKAAKKEDPKYKKANPFEGVDTKLPDKELYDKAQDAIKHGRFDVARLDLQTMLNTYQESPYMMRAKLAIADSWYKEGGTAALTQAEQEYRDFITFFPNAPEAAEAQMRIGDIYFREMDKPDRDHSKAVHAEEEYRLMLQQFPDSPRVPEAAQRLREVQESLASAEADVAAFYASRLNWPAAIARYQTVADSYPLYSHQDDVLVGLGDAFEAEARYYRTLKLPEAARAQLVKIYDDQAIAAWTKVVVEHSAASHVEDARDRLAAMNVPIPTPTPEQAAASVALENSRGQYTLSNRVSVFVLHKADTVPAATTGAPPLENAKPTLAPEIVHQAENNIKAVFSPPAPAPTPAAVQTPGEPQPAAPVVPTAAAPEPLAFQDVPAAGANGLAPSPALTAPVSSPASGGGSGIGVEIVQPSSNAPAPATQPGAAPPAFPGSAPAPDPTTAAPPAAKAVSNGDNGGIKAVGPTNATALPPIEKAAPAPDAINDVIPGSQPAAQTAPANGKTPKPAFDKSDESSSKHKKKKGLAKLNPF